MSRDLSIPFGTMQGRSLLTDPPLHTFPTDLWRIVKQVPMRRTSRTWSGKESQLCGVTKTGAWIGTGARSLDYVLVGGKDGPLYWHASAPAGMVPYHAGMLSLLPKVHVALVGPFAKPGDMRPYVFPQDFCLTLGGSRCRPEWLSIAGGTGCATLSQLAARHPRSLFVPSYGSHIGVCPGDLDPEELDCLSIARIMVGGVAEHIAVRPLQAGDTGRMQPFVGFPLSVPFRKSPRMVRTVDNAAWALYPLHELLANPVTHCGPALFLMECGTSRDGVEVARHVFPYEVLARTIRMHRHTPRMVGNPCLYARADEITIPLYVDAAGEAWSAIDAGQMPALLGYGPIPAYTPALCPAVAADAATFRDLFIKAGAVHNWQEHGLLDSDIQLVMFADETGAVMELPAFPRARMRMEIIRDRYAQLMQTALLPPADPFSPGPPEQSALGALLFAEPSTFQSIVEKLRNLQSGAFTREFSAPFPWSLLDSQANQEINRFLHEIGLADKIPILNWDIYRTGWDLTPDTPRIIELLTHLARHPVTQIIFQHPAWGKFLRDEGVAFLAAASVPHHDIVRLLSYINKEL